MKINKINVPEEILNNLDTKNSYEVEAFSSDNGLVILKSLDCTLKHGLLLHISVSKKDKLPTWWEILKIKEHFFGDIDCMMVMPRKKDYVNLHKHCLHIWTMPCEWGIQ